MPPPCNVIAELPLSTLLVTRLLISVSSPPDGPFGERSTSKMPPPRPKPARPLAFAVFPLTVVLRNVITSPATSPPPRSIAVPCRLDACTWLSLTTLFVIVPAKIVAPASASASPATELADTLLLETRVFVTVPPHSPAPESPAALPPECASAATLTVLFVITSLLNVKLTSVWRPPENAFASPTVFVAEIELPETVVLVIFAAGTVSPTWMPPPIANVPSGTSLGIDAPRLALLSVTTLESIATVPNAKMPPPSAKRPFGATALATLPVTVLLLRLMFDPGNEKIPQPSASLVTLEAHTLSLTIVLLSVSAPLVAIPPPRAAANGRSPLMQVMVMSRGQGMPESVAADGAVRLPLITLSLIVSVAPGAKFAACGTSIPPPRATNGNGLDVFRPPVIVTLAIDTVGSLDAFNTPTITTGPPRLINVKPAPAPTSWRLLSIVKPPS